MVAQEFLPKDNVRTISFKKVYTDVKNHSFFMLGADKDMKISALNGFEISGIKTDTWTISAT